MGRRLFESEEEYNHRTSEEAREIVDERTLAEETGKASSKGMFETTDEYRDRIGQEANELRNERTIAKATGSEPSTGWFESEDEYRNRISREANRIINERAVEESGGSSQGILESEKDYSARISKHAHELADEKAIESLTGTKPSQRFFEEGSAYRDRIRLEARGLINASIVSDGPAAARSRRDFREGQQEQPSQSGVGPYSESGTSATLNTATASISTITVGILLVVAAVALLQESFSETNQYRSARATARGAYSQADEDLRVTLLRSAFPKASIEQTKDSLDWSPFPSIPGNVRDVLEGEMEYIVAGSVDREESGHAADVLTSGHSRTRRLRWRLLPYRDGNDPSIEYIGVAHYTFVGVTAATCCRFFARMFLFSKSSFGGWKVGHTSRSLIDRGRAITGLQINDLDGDGTPEILFQGEGSQAGSAFVSLQVYHLGANGFEEWLGLGGVPVRFNYYYGNRTLFVRELDLPATIAAKARVFYFRKTSFRRNGAALFRPETVQVRYERGDAQVETIVSGMRP